jgi:arylsulfatase A-like enzyme
MDFISEAETDGRPWCLHLSYIKPHWPYIAPEPYASMYSTDDMIPVIRSERERQNPHPVFGAYMDMRYSRNMARDEAREKVIPTYMGLITQIDDQMGVLMKFLEERDLLETTMIVFTSDHGDYLGDHWMGEKDLFHEQSAKIPLIIIDPSKEADATRGTRSDALVEGIDLAPTFVDYFGGKVPGHILEGRSLLPLLRGSTEIHPRLRLPSDAVRSRNRSGRVRRLRRRPGMCRHRRKAAGRAVRLGAASERPHYHAARKDRELCGQPAAGEGRGLDRHLGRSRACRDQGRHRAAREDVERHANIHPRRHCERSEAIQNSSSETVWIASSLRSSQ